MAIAFRSAGAFASVGAGIALAPALPAGYQVGDLLILFTQSAYNDLDLNSASYSAGWQYGEANQSGQRIQFFWKFAASLSEYAPVTDAFNLDHACGVVHAYSGVLSGSPPYFAATPTDGSGSPQSIFYFGSPSSATANIAVICFAGHDADTSSGIATGWSYDTWAITGHTNASTATGVGGGIIIGSFIVPTSSGEQSSAVNVSPAANYVALAFGLYPAPEVVVGSASITEAADTVSSVTKLALKASVTATEANDSLSSATKILVKGSSTVTEAGDTASSATTLALKATAAITEGGDTVTSASQLALKAALALAEAGDTLLATGALDSAIEGAVSLTEGDDVVAAASALLLAAAATLGEANDVASATAALAINAALNALEGDDGASATGSLPLVAAAAITEAGDTASGAGQLATVAVLAITEGDDTVVSIGVAIIPVIVGPDYTMTALPNRIEDRTMVAPSNQLSDRTMIAQG